MQVGVIGLNVGDCFLLELAKRNKFHYFRPTPTCILSELNFIRVINFC